MGSFLNSCSITNISMQEKTLVYTVPVVKNIGYYECHFKDNTMVVSQEYNSPCYANAFWKPIGIAIVSKMEDCGKLIPLDDEMNRVSLLIFYRELAKKSLVTLLNEENNTHGCEFDFNKEWQKNRLSKVKKFSYKLNKVPFSDFLNLWTYITNAESKNRIFKKNYAGQITPIKFSSCLYEVFWEISNKYKNKFLDMNINSTKETLKQLKRDKTFDKKMESFFISNRGYELLRPPSGTQIECAYYSYLLETHNKININKKKDIKKVKDDMAEILLFWDFQYNMSELSLTFNINKYAGQDYNNKIGKNYLNLITKINKEYNAWIKEEQDDF